MSLKKLVKEMVEPIVEDMGGIVASDGTIKGGSKLSKIKRMKKKGNIKGLRNKFYHIERCGILILIIIITLKNKHIIWVNV